METARPRRVCDDLARVAWGAAILLGTPGFRSGARRHRDYDLMVPNLLSQLLEAELLEAVALFEKAQGFADDLARREIEAALHLVVDEPLELLRERDVGHGDAGTVWPRLTGLASSNYDLAVELAAEAEGMAQSFRGVTFVRDGLTSPALGAEAFPLRAEELESLASCQGDGSLATLPRQEAIAFGSAFPVPVHLGLADASPVPQSRDPRCHQAWSGPSATGTRAS